MRRWMPLALGELGVHETPGPAATARIVEYDRATSLKATSDEVPWCSAFVNWVVKEAGGIPTDSARARSWLAWGYPLVEPRYGCVVVLSRPPDPSQGHVAFFVDEDESMQTIFLLGGNQADQVKVSAFSRASVVGYRWPAAT